jgi:putative membrane protein
MKTDHRGLWIVLGVLALVVLLGALAGGGVMGPGMMWGYGAPAHGTGWIWGLGWLVMLAFWGALIVGGILLVRWLIDRSHARGDLGADDPQAVLRRRYAAGEIDQATHERMKQELGGTTEQAPGSPPTASRTNGQEGDVPVLPSRGRSGPR